MAVTQSSEHPCADLGKGEIKCFFSWLTAPELVAGGGHGGEKPCSSRYPIGRSDVFVGTSKNSAHSIGDPGGVRWPPPLVTGHRAVAGFVGSALRVLSAAELVKEDRRGGVPFALFVLPLWV